MKLLRGGWLRLLPIVALGLFLGGLAVDQLAPAPCPERSQTTAKDFPAQSWMARAGKASALPTFARKYNMACSVCHTAQPYLNATGRLFKESGYRFVRTNKGDSAGPGEKKLLPQLLIEGELPLALGIEGTPLMVNEDLDGPAFRPFQNVSLYSAGTVGPNTSYFVQLKAADEGPGTFEMSTVAYVGWYGSKYLNVVAGQGEPFRLDPYNTLAGHTLTSGHSHPDAAKFVSLYGRASKLYYLSTFSTGGDGLISNTVLGSGRVAYDATSALSLGAYGQLGRQGTEGVEEAITTDPGDVTARVSVMNEGHGEQITGPLVSGGIDVNLIAGGINGLLKVQYQRIDGEDETDEDITGDLQLFYTMMKNGRPLLVPLVQVKYEQPVGDAPSISATANLSSYVLANVRLGIEGTYDVLVQGDAEQGYQAMTFAAIYW